MGARRWGSSAGVSAAVVLVALALPMSFASAQTPAVLVLGPGTVSVAAGELASTVAVISNATDGEFTSLELAWLGADGLDVAVDGAASAGTNAVALGTLEAKDQRAVEIQVARSTAARLPATLSFRLEYDDADGHHVESANLTVTDVSFAGPSSVLSFAPASLEVAVGEPEETVLVIANTSDADFADVELRWVAANDVTIERVDGDGSADPVEDGRIELDPIPSGSERAVVLRVTRGPDARVPGTIRFRLEFDDGVAAHHVETADLSLALRNAAVSAGFFTAIVSTTVTELQEHRDGAFFVKVDNTSDEALQISRISVELPAGVRLCFASKCSEDERLDVAPDALPAGGSIAPHQSAIYRMEATALDAVQPGPARMVFVVEADNDDPSYAKRQVVEKDVTLSILGETTFLTVVGVPSFLLLPGFLLLVGARLARSWQAGAPAADAPGPVNKGGFDLPTGQFWALAVSLSLVAMLVYPLITGLFGPTHRRSYVDGYGLTDIRNVWLGAMAIGLVVGGFPAFVRWVRTTLATRKVPTGRDDARAVLARLARVGSPTTLRQVRFSHEGAVVQGFVAYELPDGALWVVPPIGVQLSASATPTARSALLDSIESGDAGAATDGVARARQEGSASVAWQGRVGFTRPVKVAKADVTATCDGRSIFERVEA